MIYKRHKWGKKVTNRRLESSSVACVQCGCVRQYVGGIVTYFVSLGQIVYDRYAPPCDSKNKKYADEDSKVE